MLRPGSRSLSAIEVPKSKEYPHTQHSFSDSIAADSFHLYSGWADDVEIFDKRQTDSRNCKLRHSVCFDKISIPVTAVFDNPLLGFVIDMDEAEAFAETQRPFEVVH